MDDYEVLLRKGMARIKRVEEKERLEIPRPDVMRSGQRTVVHNFIEIAGILRREPAHMLKYFAKVLATFGEVKGQKVEFIGNFTPEIMGRRLDDYIKIFVTCQECKKLDTRLIKEDKYHFIRCEACGARHPVEKV